MAESLGSNGLNLLCFLWASAGLVAGCVGAMGESGSGAPADIPAPGDAGAGGGGSPAEPDGARAERPGGIPMGTASGPPAEPSCAPPATQTADVGQYLNRIASCAFKARTARLAGLKSQKDIADRQAYVRAQLRVEIGDLPEPDIAPQKRTPLAAKVIGQPIAKDGYRLEKITYESQPGLLVTANLYLPTTGKGPFPAVLGLTGHSLSGKTAYQMSWIPLAQRGIAVFAFDPPGQGEREELDGPNECCDGEHMTLGPQVLLTGMNLARYFIWDAIRAVDYLSTRPEIDPGRIGATGLSGGGTLTMYLAAFEPRLAAAVASSSMSSWPAWWELGGMGDSEQNFARFIRDGLDASDFPLGMAPRPFKFINGMQDPDFPVAGAAAAFREAKSFYEMLGQVDAVDFDTHSDGHAWTTFTRVETVLWFERWLKGATTREKASYEAVVNAQGNSSSDMQVTPTGLITTSYPAAKGVHVTNREIADRMYRSRSASQPISPDKLRDLVRARIGAVGSDRSGVPASKLIGMTRRSGYTEQRFTIETEPAFVVYGSLLLPADTAGQSPAVLYVGPVSTSTDGVVDPDAEAIVRAGLPVLMLQPRASDLDYRTPGHLASSTGYTRSQKALLLGKTLVGLRVTDVLRGFDFLAVRPEVDPMRIALFGRGRDALAALHAAVLEPRVQKVAVEDLLLSYLDVTRVRIPFVEIHDLVVPGVLADYDLPDLAKALAPRPVWVVSPRRADAPIRAASSAEIAAAYGASGAVLASRGAGASFMDVYRQWLEAR